MNENIVEQEQEDANGNTIHFGWESMKVYTNIHGDICFSQQSPVFGEEVVICIPSLYVDHLKWHIDKALRDFDDED
jgi:hypothetical protein